MSTRYTGNSKSPVTSEAPGENWQVRTNDKIQVDDSHGFRFEHDNVSLVVKGQIETEGSSSSAVYSEADGSFTRVTKTGQVDGDLVGIRYSKGSDDGKIKNDGDVTGKYGIAVQGSGHSVINKGDVEGGSFGIYLDGTDQYVINTGTVESGDAGVWSFASNSRIENDGEITGGNYGVWMPGYNNVLVNTGTISAEDTDAAVYGSKYTQTVYNTGKIDGNVELHGGEDIYIGQKQGEVTGNVLGGDGNDVLQGGKYKDRFYGEEGNDTLKGAANKDKLFGGAGDDKLSGGAHNDKLKGGEGEDTLTGGTGNDKLFGGADADTFVFKGRTDKDVIKDWEDGSDIIDLTAYDISNTNKFLKKAISEKNGDAYVDLEYAGGDGSIKIEGAAGEIDYFDFAFG